MKKLVISALTSMTLLATAPSLFAQTLHVDKETVINYQNDGSAKWQVVDATLSLSQPDKILRSLFGISVDVAAVGTSTTQQRELFLNSKNELANFFEKKIHALYNFEDASIDYFQGNSQYRFNLGSSIYRELMPLNYINMQTPEDGIGALKQLDNIQKFINTTLPRSTNTEDLEPFLINTNSPEIVSKAILTVNPYANRSEIVDGLIKLNITITKTISQLTTLASKVASGKYNSDEIFKMNLVFSTKAFALITEISEKTVFKIHPFNGNHLIITDGAKESEYIFPVMNLEALQMADAAIENVEQAIASVNKTVSALFFVRDWILDHKQPEINPTLVAAYSKDLLSKKKPAYRFE